MPSKKIAVLGGGASGLTAAIAAAKAGAEVTIIEHKDRVGKKILMTGNGKCNLTNLHMERKNYYSHDLEKAMRILASFEPQDTIAFFRELGLMTKEKREGGIYPVSEQAATVLDVLRDTCEELKIKTFVGCHIRKIQTGKSILLSGIQEIPVESEKKKEKKRQPKTPSDCIQKKYEDSFDALILACGGCAAPASGSDGSGFELIKSLGYKIYEPVPALVQLHGKGDFYKSIAGVRTEASVKLYIDNKACAQEYGELQITDYGISGIPVFQISRIAAVALAASQECKVEIDFYPYDAMPLNWDAHGRANAEVFLEGYLNKKLAALLLKRAGVSCEQKVCEISQKSRNRIFTEMHHFMITIEKTNGFDSAQVCAGGISLKDIHETLNLKKYPNIYVVGELLDVDGKCGGYNLQWAWATGYQAGKNAALCTQ